jgi:TrmH family RNA methyltransferase
MSTILSSPHNPRVKAVAALRERRQREREQLTVVDGYDELSVALDCGARPVALYVCPAQVRDRRQMALAERARQAGAEIVEAEPRAFEKMAYRDDPDGWLGVFPLARRGLDDLALGAAPLLLVAEAVEKPGNLGAMLRTADAAGVDALISCDPNTDLGNPNVARSSKGALFSVPVAETSTDQAVAWLRKRGIRILAATPDAESPFGPAVLFTRAELRGPLAIAVGAERPGLSPAWLRQADLRAHIPMFGRVNSLNVATAAALLVYEAVKQRRLAGEATIGQLPESTRRHDA